jgi:hypothetical protein
MRSYPCNTPWTPIWLSQVETTVFPRLSSHRWSRDCQPYGEGGLYLPKSPWCSFLLEADSPPGIHVAWKYSVNWKIRWSHRELNSRSSGLQYCASTNRYRVLHPNDQYIYSNETRSLLWSNGRSSWLLIQRSWDRFLALSDVLRSSGSRMGFTHTRGDKWGATWKKM